MKVFIVLLSISAVLAAPAEQVISNRYSDAISTSEAHASINDGNSGTYFQQSGANSGPQSASIGDHTFTASASNSGAHAELFNKNTYLGTTVNSGAAAISLHQSPNQFSGAHSNSAAIAVSHNHSPLEDNLQNGKIKRNAVKASANADSHASGYGHINAKTERSVVKASANAASHASNFGHSNANSNANVNTYAGHPHTNSNANANSNAYTHNSNPGYSHTNKVNSGAMSVAIKTGPHNVDVHAKGSGQAQSTLFFNSSPSFDYYGNGSKAQAGASASSYGGVNHSGAQASAHAQSSSSYGYYPQNVDSYANSKASANAQIKQY